jgi:membrane-bound metal-dependent hydrolase YbcI (DUF457 family)
MGSTHALSGWCAGLAVAPALGLSPVPTVVFATVTAGYALAPDLDCGSATASRLLGPVTGLVSTGLRAASRTLYAATKGPRDENWSGEHRHLSHTVLFALAAGGLTALATALGGSWATLAVLLFGVLLAQAALGDWIALVAAGGGLVLALHGFTAALDDTRPWLWIAVTLGCVTHVAGDGLTLAGVPALAPIPIRGEVWFELGSPRVLRFRTGGTVEHRFVFPVFAVLGVLLLPGVWDTAMALFHHHNA